MALEHFNDKLPILKDYMTRVIDQWKSKFINESLSNADKEIQKLRTYQVNERI